MATHELFHLGNPTLEEKKLPWLVEGFTTYYQDVLRGRRGAAEAARMWGDLYDGCHRFGDPEGGVSLEEESRRLRESHNYPRVYWGGACLALRLDVAIRERSGNTRSLDDVMRDLRRRSAARPFTAARILDELARETGDSPSVIARTGGFARAHLRATRPLGLDELYRRLGLEPTGSASVKLLDDAPLAPIRRGIF